MRATRHIPVTYQVLAQTTTPAGHFTGNPVGVFIYDMYGRGWGGSGEPDESG